MKPSWLYKLNSKEQPQLFSRPKGVTRSVSKLFAALMRLPSAKFLDFAQTERRRKGIFVLTFATQ